MGRIHQNIRGDHLNKMIFLIYGLCFVASCFGAMAADTSSESGYTTLAQDSGKNASDMNISLFTITDEFDIEGLDVAEAVKFKAPSSDWKLYGVKVLGWSDYNSTDYSYNMDRNFLLEIRDKDLHLLYRFADAQNGYFLTDQGPIWGVIEIPPLAVTEDFYVLFYDRGGMVVGMEYNNGTGNSFLYGNRILTPAEWTTEANETIGINWMIEAVGK